MPILRNARRKCWMRIAWAMVTLAIAFTLGPGAPAGSPGRHGVPAGPPAPDSECSDPPCGEPPAEPAPSPRAPAQAGPRGGIGTLIGITFA